MSIDDAKPEDWDKLADRYYDNREFPKDVKPECTLIRGKPPETGKFEWDRYAPSPDDYVDGPFGAIHKSEMTPDPVEKPAHYRVGEVEAIDYIHQQLGTGVKDYLLGNVHKYLHRHRFKGQAVEDLRKARWYLEKLIFEEVQGGMDDE